jgi:GNAT superfamily N-acetyltransferase
VSSTQSPIDALEAIAYELWVAPEVEEVDGWRLRFAHGLTGRANSVWPNGGDGTKAEEKIERVEAWYRERGAPAVFQLTDAARPRELDALLAARGYSLRGAPVAVQTAELAEVVATTSGSADVSEDVDDAWVAFWAGSRDFARLDVARALLTTGRTAFARSGGDAVGRGVVVGDWLGITSMATRPEARRRGHGRAILHALARWGAANGCTHALLQVEHGNTGAETLYARAGFRREYDYHYRVLA